jgi:DNA-directed RNA polymerase subunit RPC12/RpoP
MERRVAEYVRRVYGEEGRVPSVREILGVFGLCRASFYGMFRGGLREVCVLAGVPVPVDRLRRMRRVSSFRREDFGVRLRGARDRWEAFVKGYRMRVEALELEARLDPAKAPAYAREVMPRLDPDLWRKLTLIAGDGVDEVVVEALSMLKPYKEVVKDVVVKGGKRIPSFRDHLCDALRFWLRRAIRNKLPAKSEPRVVYGRCGKCGEAIEYGREEGRNILVCPKCRVRLYYYCPICGSEMLFEPPIRLECPNCGYREVVSEEILPQITVDYACYCAYWGINDPRLKGKRLVIVRKKPDGSEEIDVYYRW